MTARQYLRPQWPAVSGVGAAFTLRAGGLSVAPHESFNLATHVGDAPDAVRRNRDLLQRDLALPAEPLWLEQIHGSDVLDTDMLWAGPPSSAAAGAVARADGAVSRRPGVVLAVLVADCLPVLFAARDGSAVAVAHAGWRGLAAGILERTVQALAGSGALQAWIGPSISSAHFEVGEEVRAALLAHDSVAHEPSAEGAFAVNARGRWQCDLQALARARLSALGVGDVYVDGHCSFAQPQRFFSHRRDGPTGRMAALIWLHAVQYQSLE